MRSKILSWLRKSINSVPTPFDYSFQIQEAYLNKFNEPSNLIERSFYQYKCQMRSRHKGALLMLDFVSFFGVICYTVLNIRWKARKKNVLESKIALFPFKGSYENIIPKELKEEYEILEIDFDKKRYLAFSDLVFLKNIWLKYPTNFYFLFKIIYKVSLYRFMIDNYSLKAIIVASEYSFTSSVLTLYCRSNSVNHINVMHGEKMLNIRDSFFQFDRCYVWDEHYVKMFIELRADPNQFIISSSNPFYFNLEGKIECDYYATYYLGAEDEIQMNKINQMFIDLNLENRKICIRLHPRYTNVDIAHRIFSKYNIEQPRIVPIKDSLEKTENIISCFSTVLYLGYVNGKNIFIDDVTTDQKQINIYKELKYIMLSKPHRKMSELVMENHK